MKTCGKLYYKISIDAKPMQKQLRRLKRRLFWFKLRMYWLNKTKIDNTITWIAIGSLAALAFAILTKVIPVELFTILFIGFSGLIGLKLFIELFTSNKNK